MEEKIKKQLGAFPSSFQTYKYVQKLGRDSREIIVDKLMSERETCSYGNEIDDIRDLNFIAFLYFSLGKYDKAIEYSDNVLQRNGTNINAVACRAWFHLYRSEFSASNGMCEKLETVQHNTLQLLVAKAEVGYAWSRLGMKNYKEAEKMFNGALDGSVDCDVPQYYICAWKFGLALTIRRQLYIHNLHDENIDSLDLLKGRCNSALHLFLDIIEMEGNNLDKQKAMSYVQVGDIFGMFKLRKDFFQKALLCKIRGFNIHQKIEFCFDEGLKIQPDNVFVLERCAKYLRLVKKIDRSIELCKRAISIRETSTSHHYLALALRLKLDGSQYKQDRAFQTARLQQVQPIDVMDEKTPTRTNLAPGIAHMDEYHANLESGMHHMEDRTKPHHVRNIQTALDSNMSWSPTEEEKEKDQVRRLDSGIYSMEEHCEPTESEEFESKNGNKLPSTAEDQLVTTKTRLQTISGAADREELDDISKGLQSLTITKTEEGKSSDMALVVTTGASRGHEFRDKKGSGRQSQRSYRSSNRRKPSRKGNHQSQYNYLHFPDQYGCDGYYPRQCVQQGYYGYDQYGQYFPRYNEWGGCNSYFTMNSNRGGHSQYRGNSRPNWIRFGSRPNTPKYMYNKYNGPIKGRLNSDWQHSLVTPEYTVLSKMIKSPRKVKPLPPDEIEEIIKHLDRAIAINENTGALYDKGLVKRAAGLYDEALDVFKSMFNNSRCSIVGLANAYEQAALCLNEKCERNKTSTDTVVMDMKEYLLKSIEITCNLISKLPQLKHCWKSFPTLKSLLEEKPHYKHNLKELGQLHQKVQNYSEAIGWYKQALETETDDHQKACTHMDIVTNSLKVGNYDEAILNIDMVLCFPDGRSKVDEDLYFEAHIEGGLKAFAAEEKEVARIRLKNALNYKMCEENTEHSDTSDDALEDTINPKRFEVFILCDQNIEHLGRKILDQLCNLGLDATVNDDYARADETVVEGIAEVIDASRHSLIVLGENMESMKKIKLYTNIIQRTQEDHGFGNTVVVIENDKVKVDRMFRGFPSIEYNEILSSADANTVETKEMLFMLASGHCQRPGSCKKQGQQCEPTI